MTERREVDAKTRIIYESAKKINKIFGGTEKKHYFCNKTTSIMETTYQDFRNERNASESNRHVIPRSRLSDYLSVVSKEDIPWAVNFLVSKLIVHPESSNASSKHTWDNYQLSAEMEAFSSFDRKSLPSDYDAALTKALEEKHS